MHEQCQSVLDELSIVDHIEPVRFVDFCSTPFSKLPAVVCEHDEDPVW